MPACSATLAAPFRGENEQCCLASQRDISAPWGRTTEEMLGGGWRGRRHIMSHTSMQMPSDGTDISVPALMKTDCIIIIFPLVQACNYCVK